MLWWNSAHGGMEDFDLFLQGPIPGPTKASSRNLGPVHRP